ncbi:MAG TPA: VWA domain-containing protein [Pyrinomonadaceae bacterium]|nr:VWA domain-containing protein [Pyrinomonadaceae bacterium]
MKSCLILLLVALCSVVANAQQQDEVIRVNTELVQTAVTVLDKKGSFVEGLQRDQFELVVDGKPRPVAFFERVASGSARERELANPGNPNEPAITNTAPAATPRIPGRTIVFFLDDLHLSPDSMNRTRMMLRHFLDREMSSKDNIAILTASGQVGFLEQFTNNKAVLDTALGRLVPRPYDANGYSAGGSARMTEFMAFQLNTGKTDRKVLDAYVGECMKGANNFKKTAQVLALIRQACETEVKNSARAILMQAAQITQNTYNSLESAMRSVSRVPGRKLAFFISDGFLFDAGPNAAGVRDKLDHVIDAAQRAGVVVYTIHAAGLVNSSYLDPSFKKPMDERLLVASIGELEAYQDALNGIAHDTGGRALRSTNFFDEWVTTVLDETSNYYVVAWRPEKDEEKVAKFRNVKITVVGRPELTVRAPRGYVNGHPKPAEPTPAAAAASEKPASKKGPDAELRDALSDFYPTGGLPTMLSLTYLNTPANGLVVTSSMEISGSGVSYGDDRKQPATITLAGVVLNDKGKIASSFKNQLNIDPPKAGGSDAIFYNHHTPLAPGIYQFRVAARDEKSGRVGSAIQWIVIPDLAKSQLTLSSVLLGGQVLEDKSKAGTPHVQLSVDHSFSRSSQLGYWVFVYNAKRDASGTPQLTVQTQVLRDGQAVLSSPQRKLSSAGQDVERIPFGEVLALKTLAPGKYDLKVIVTDGVAGTSASQLADFVVR